MRSGANGSRYRGKKVVPTTLLKAFSRLAAEAGSTPSTSFSTNDSRTRGVIPEMPDPATATPRAHDTSSTAAPLRTAPPAASTARNGCHEMVSRRRAPAYWKTACPRLAVRITMNSAPRDTSTDGFASPSATGASQTPVRPPSRSPAVAHAPVMKPCQ